MTVEADDRCQWHASAQLERARGGGGQPWESRQHLAVIQPQGLGVVFGVGPGLLWGR